jgi:hypothetical protein
VCDLETSRIGAPYIYDISILRVNAFHVYILVIFASVVMWGTVWAELAANDFALEVCL